MTRTRGSELGVVCAAAWLLAGCGGSVLSEVAADQPHGLVVLGFEYKDPDYVYEHEASIDGGKPAKVTAGEEIRLRSGPHTLTLVAITYAPEFGVEQVTQPTCEGPYCTSMSTRIVTRPGMVLKEKERCTEEIALGVAPGDKIHVLQSVSRDQTCQASLTVQ
ncbi:MAG TPA: hypothetical protein VJU61_26050 [Polyangiaceae bacterium]|nr:hypothetical protein [Polyangiaceae bacterium]